MSEGDNGEAAAAVAAAVAEETTTTTVVERPEHCPEKFWDAENKAIRNDDVLKSYNELSVKFGSFTGSPDEYVVGLSDELKEKGVELKDDDPMLDQAKEFAKELGMNQEGFSKMVNLYGMQELARATAEQEAVTADIASLGDDADRRLANLSQWASTNLPEDLQEGFKDLTGSADAVRALEQVISMGRNAAVQVKDAAAAASITQEEVAKMQFEKDENGNRRIHTDADFKKRYDTARHIVHGTEPHREIIGA